MLWEMIAAAGLSETVRARQTRVPPTDHDPRSRRGKPFAQQGRNSTGPGSASTPPVGTMQENHQHNQHGHSGVVSERSSRSGRCGSCSSAASEAVPLFWSEEDEYLHFKLRQIAAVQQSTDNNDDEGEQKGEEEEWEEDEELKFVSPEMVWEFNEFCRKRDAARGVLEQAEENGRASGLC